MDRQPHPVDRRVARNIRRLRTAAGLSQSDLGRACGVSFQQLQKYETGADRITPGRLADMATRLGVPLMAFFEGCAPAQAAEPVAAE